MRVRDCRLVAGLALCAVVTLAAADGGFFQGDKRRLALAGAYAFWGESAGRQGVQVIKVAVSNAKFSREAFDAFVDRRRIIDTQFVDDDDKVVYLEFDADGRFRGYSYYFGPGDGCGFCFDSRTVSTVKPDGGRLKGRVAYDGKPKSAAFEVEVDVAMPDREWGDALPAGGGEPARAFAAYHAALKGRDRKALAAAQDGFQNELLGRYEKRGELSQWLDYRHDEYHGGIDRYVVVKGYVRGDRAVLLFTGEGGTLGKVRGEVALRREGGAWKVHDEFVTPGS